MITYCAGSNEYGLIDHSGCTITVVWLGAVQQALKMTIEIEQEADGRWIAEVREVPGALFYCNTREEAIQSVKALALRVIADRLEHGEPVPAVAELFRVAA